MKQTIEGIKTKLNCQSLET